MPARVYADTASREPSSNEAVEHVAGRHVPGSLEVFRLALVVELRLSSCGCRT